MKKQIKYYQISVVFLDPRSKLNDPRGGDHEQLKTCVKRSDAFREAIRISKMNEYMGRPVYETMIKQYDYSQIDEIVGHWYVKKGKIISMN